MPGRGYARMPRHATRRSAYTLAEMIVSMAIMFVLMGSMATAVHLAGQALPDEESLSARTRSCADHLTILSEDLSAAIHIIEQSPHAVAVTVPDRDGNGLPEWIRYAWGGDADTPAPLTRQYNGGTEATLIEDVQWVEFEYDTTSGTERYDGPYINTPEILLDSMTKVIWPKNQQITSSEWLGQYIEPRYEWMTGDVTGWRITRTGFQARGYINKTGTSQVQIRKVDNDKKPEDDILQQVLLQESSLSDHYTWVWQDWSNMPVMSPGEGAALVIEYGGGSPTTAEVAYDPMVPEGLLVTYNGGWYWYYRPYYSLYHKLYGVITTKGPPRSVRHDFTTTVKMTFRLDDQVETFRNMACYMPNCPEQVVGIWEAEFEGNPAAADYNGDGLGDWVMHDGSAFNTSSLADGVWEIDGQLDSAADFNFDQLTVIDLRWRADSSGNQVVCRLNADWSGGQYAPILAKLKKMTDGTQTLYICDRLNEMTDRILLTKAGLGSDFVQLRLLIDAGQDTINLRVNGNDCGTAEYNSINPSHSDKKISLYASGASGECDYISVRAKTGSTPVSNHAPMAAMQVSPMTATSGTAITFNAGNSSDADGDPLSYAWNFGDGSQNSGSSVTHTYSEPGDYSVILTAYDQWGAYDCAVVTLDIN